MNYDSLFSDFVKQKIHRIVEDSENPTQMTTRVTEQFGEAAVSLARQTAMQVKGSQWLRQETVQATRVEGAGLSNSDATDTSKQLAMALERGQTAKALSLKSSGVEMEDTPNLTSNQTSHRFGYKAAQAICKLWSEFSTFIWICLVIAVLAKCVDSHEKQKVIDEKASIGTLASANGALFASAYKSCSEIGLPDFDKCASSSGILVQDKVAKQLASLAITQREEYIATC